MLEMGITECDTFDEGVVFPVVINATSSGNDCYQIKFHILESTSKFKSRNQGQIEICRVKFDSVRE